MDPPQSQSRSFKVDGSFQLKVESGEESLLPPLMKHDSHLDTFKTNEAEKNSFKREMNIWREMKFERGTLGE